jgi:DNA polymerase III subunit gamma/tau
MALDTKYRPRIFSDVVGQDGSIQILKQIVKTGTGFHQSYVFSGSYGSGKTTMARILARALLCESHVNGDPCDSCESCLEILSSGTSAAFTEVDAATQSSKEDVKRIRDQIAYDGLAGRRKIFLFDEAHRLSKDATDALLKPMEDDSVGTDEKQLVCIFCTTEPENMRDTLFSRCTMFQIKRLTPENISERLMGICGIEGITATLPALRLIAEVAECHMRNAIKSLEGVSRMGDVTEEAVHRYLHMGVNDQYLTILRETGRDLQAVMTASAKLQEAVSPSTAYSRLSEVAMMVYRYGVGASKVPSYWDTSKVEAVWDRSGDGLLMFANIFASKPGHPTFSMFDCDLCSLHVKLVGVPTKKLPTLHEIVQSAPQHGVAGPHQVGKDSAPGLDDPGPVVGKVPEVRDPAEDVKVTKPTVTKTGVFVNPAALRQKEPARVHPENPDTTITSDLSPDRFRDVLSELLQKRSVDGSRK